MWLGTGQALIYPSVPNTRWALNAPGKYWLRSDPKIFSISNHYTVQKWCMCIVGSVPCDEYVELNSKKCTLVSVYDLLNIIVDMAGFRFNVWLENLCFNMYQPTITAKCQQIGKYILTYLFHCKFEFLHNPDKWIKMTKLIWSPQRYMRNMYLSKPSSRMWH